MGRFIIERVLPTGYVHDSESDEEPKYSQKDLDKAVADAVKNSLMSQTVAEAISREVLNLPEEEVKKPPSGMGWQDKDPDDELMDFVNILIQRRVDKALENT